MSPHGAENLDGPIGHPAGHLRTEARNQGRIPRFFGPNWLGSRR